MVNEERSDDPESLVRGALLALADGLDCLDAPARRDVQAFLDLPDALVLRAVAADVARVVSLARAGLLVPRDDLPLVRGLPWSPDEGQASLFPPSTSGGTTGRRRS